MDLPDESQWDETTCGLAVCQHPQCWATILRIERGHPRILGSSCKSPLNAEDRLPVLTLVNIADSCFQARRLAHHHLSEFTFTKPHSLLPQGSKFGSEFQGSLLLDKGKPIPYPEMKTHLAMMKKKPPLEKSHPDSAISAKMCLTVHRLTLQRPALRYPEHLKKFNCNLTTEDHRNLPGQESRKKQQKQMKIEGPTLKQAFQDSTEKPQVDYSKKHLDSFPSKKSPELPRIECTHKDIRTQMEVLLEAQKRTPNSTSGIGWNPELKLLRILQATGDEDEENQPSGAQSEESLEA
ncbi:hypothetical protein CB1_056242006 [Camelus ferus]|nr:hypothetical protein CB1_056242006 [Camelus ferus]